MRFKSLALCASIAILSACGGGGDSSPPPATGGGPDPAPPTTPPPPAITYTAFNDLTGDQTFDTACSADRFGQTGPGFTTFSEFFTFGFTENGETWTVAGPTRTGNLDETFGPGDIGFQDTGVIAYGKDSSAIINGRAIRNIFAINTPQLTGGITDFVRLGSVFIVPVGETRQAQFRCVFGVPTQLDDDLPTTTIAFGNEIEAVGTAVQTSAGSAPVGFNLDASQITFSADPTNGQVTFTLTLQGREIIPDPNGGPATTSNDITPFGSFTGTANVSDTVQGFEGITLDGSGAGVGDFTGWFFGPQGAEFGIAIDGSDQLQDASQIDFFLALAGTQN